MLALCNLELTTADLTELSKASIVSFIAPLFALVHESGGAAHAALAKKLDDAEAKAAEAKAAEMKSSGATLAPWNVRYSAYSLFRLLSYSASAAAANEQGTQTFVRLAC